MSEGPLWTARVREMLGLLLLITCVGNVLGSWPGQAPGLLQKMLN